MRNKGSA